MADCRAARLLREVVDCEPESLPAYNVRADGERKRREGEGGRGTRGRGRSQSREVRKNSTKKKKNSPPQDEEVRLVVEECHEHYALMREIFG